MKLEKKLEINKKKSVIIIVSSVTILFIVFYLIFLHFLIIKTKNIIENNFNNLEANLKNIPTNLENEIYFNLWFYVISQKNEISKFLTGIDLESGRQYNNDEKYILNNSDYIKLSDIWIMFKYLEKSKTLKIFLDIWDSKTGKDITYSDMSEEITKKICRDIITIFRENLLIPFGEKNYDITKDFINYIEFSFNKEDNEAGFIVWVVTYKRSNTKDILDFDFFKNSKIVE